MWAELLPRHPDGPAHRPGGHVALLGVLAGLACQQGALPRLSLRAGPPRQLSGPDVVVSVAAAAAANDEPSKPFRKQDGS